MFSNFIQKPIGIITILGAAVGGPYAAFETDIGTQLRQGLARRMTHSSSSESTLNQSEPADPYSLVASNVSNRASFGTGIQASPLNQNDLVRQYGPATVQPVGTTLPFSANASALPPQISFLETRTGPPKLVPGKTDQLWDYTIGTPTLNQIQQQPNITVGGGTVNDLREVLRFDIVPGWLPQRFARVSTVTSNVQMDGLRVPLITGIQPNDIAGTLTYFFDASKSLKRIQLHGLTGDPSKLANLMVQFYQLAPEQSLGGQLFTTRWNNRITSVMQISPAPIMYAGADHSKYILFLELNQPTNQYGLSEEASEVLRTSQAAQRW